MPKKASSGSRTAVKREDGAPVGYYVYSNGDSIWGTGIYKRGETPLLANKETHQLKPDERITWHKEETASRAKAEAEKK